FDLGAALVGLAPSGAARAQVADRLQLLEEPGQVLHVVPEGEDLGDGTVDRDRGSGLVGTHGVAASRVMSRCFGRSRPDQGAASTSSAKSNPSASSWGGIRSAPNCV